jgi:hypothetical protein
MHKTMTVYFTEETFRRLETLASLHGGISLSAKIKDLIDTEWDENNLEPVPALSELRDEARKEEAAQ